MSLREQLTEDMKNAMRARDGVRLNAIRFLLSELKNYEIDHGEQTDDGTQKVIAKQVKQMKEAIEEYRRGNREDLVADESEKVKILEEYLPAQMTDDELRAVVAEVVAANPGAQPGPLTGQVMQRVKGQADGSRVSAMIAAVLADVG